LKKKRKTWQTAVQKTLSTVKAEMQERINEEQRLNEKIRNLEMENEKIQILSNQLQLKEMEEKKLKQLLEDTQQNFSNSELRLQEAKKTIESQNNTNVRVAFLCFKCASVSIVRRRRYSYR